MGLFRRQSDGVKAGNKLFQNWVKENSDQFDNKSKKLKGKSGDKEKKNCCS